MAEMLTKRTRASVPAFLKRIADAELRADSAALATLMEKVTGAKPVLWGDGILGFGNRHYKYASGREIDWFVIGFAPRKKTGLSLYLSCAIEEHATQLNRLGKHSTGKGCLYIKRLSDIKLPELKKLIKTAVKLSKS